MWIKITGTESAVLASLAKEGGLVVTDHFPAYHIRLDSGKVLCPTVDGIDCELERQIVNNLGELSPSGKVLLQRAGGVQSDREVHIVVPAQPGEISKGCQAIVRALLNHRDRKQPWYSRYL